MRARRHWRKSAENKTIETRGNKTEARAREVAQERDARGAKLKAKEGERIVQPQTPFRGT